MPLRRVLFVCVENACRSQMAEAFARVHGGGRIEAQSAGSRPSGHLNVRAVEFMRERGIDLSTQRSKGLSEVAGLCFAAVVTMGCGDACPSVPAARRVEWDIPDPKKLPDAEFRAIRDRIERAVLELLAVV
jgi:protein-tyrosine-phosphatase